MASSQFASLTAGMLARKGEAKPSQEPSFGSKPWQPPVIPASSAPPARTQVAHQAPATASAPPDIMEMKVRLQDVAAVWPQAKPTHAPDNDGSGWVPAKQHRMPPPQQLEGFGQPVKTTIRLTHQQVRAVKLAALILDKPQQEILTAGLLGKLETLACTDLSSCTCFKAVIEGLRQPGADEVETPLAY